VCIFFILQHFLFINRAAALLTSHGNSKIQ
jgi:hypothetical protein